jgi:hypothetical protein
VAGDKLPPTPGKQRRTGPDGRLYAATHRRGIWAIDTRKLR